MNPLSSLLLASGSLVALLAGMGLLRFSTAYARFHAAGKASPIAFILIAIGSAIELGWEGAALLLLTSVAMVLTLPVGVHLIFRATHRTTPGAQRPADDVVVVSIPSQTRATPAPDAEERT